MSSLIFELKKNNHKDIFEIYNNPNEKNPIKLLIDSPNRFNSFQSKLKEEKKLEKHLRNERKKKYFDNILELKPKLKKAIDDDYPNIRYNSDKKINVKISKNIINEINYDDNEIYTPKYINTVRNNKFMNNNYNKKMPNKFNIERKFLGGSPLVSHSLDIINNNPYNKRKFIKSLNHRVNDINKILYKNNEYTEETYFIKKNINISPINFNSRQEKKIKNKNIRKIDDEDYLNLDDLKKKKNYKKGISYGLIDNNNNIKNKIRSLFVDSCKDLKNHRNNLIYLKDMKYSEGNRDDIDKIISDNININLFEEKLLKIKNNNTQRNNPTKMKNYCKERKNYSEEGLSEKKKENIEFISDDELTEYYVNKCNIVLEYAYKEDRNRLHKINMEDKGKSILNFNNDPEKILFCLFDGHGGDKVSAYLQKNFWKIMKKYLNDSIDGEINYEALFSEIDQEFKHSKYYQIGSTATIIYIKKEIRNKKSLYCINIGDTKCILTQTTGSRKLSYDDLLSDEYEYNRIINEGGFIKNGRVGGQLMISRAFGDWESKSYGVICTPHIKKIDIDDKCKYVILASDGIWDVLDDLDVYKFTLTAENSKKLCDDIIQNALDRESIDNISCFVIKLND